MDLTFVVMTVSSTYSPAPSCFEVDAHPTKKVNKTMNDKAEKIFFGVMVQILLIEKKLITP
jgi:hypothetical protein